MDELNLSIAGNYTKIVEDRYDGNSSFNATTADSTTLLTITNQTVPAQLVAAVGIVIMGIGSCANAMVLTVLLRARRQFGSSVHTLIANQSAMDLFTCAFGMCTLVMMITHGYRYNSNPILDGTICVLLESTALTALGLTASIIGLMVITLERYFKIVHAIAHRKYYREWMTKVGVALPWIGGTCLILLPGIGTTRIVNGHCLRMGVWPNKGMAKAFSVVRFLFHYGLPVIIFAYCYGRIFHTSRRQSKVSHGTGNVGRNQDVAMATTSRDQLQQQGTGATTGAKLSRTELNILQTMIIIIACFVICWSVPAISNLLQFTGITTLDRNAFFLSGSLAYISFCLNPFIYVSRYEVFRRYLKQLLNKSSSATAPTTTGNTG